ncbi:ankyrin repeat-containing domain protein [Coprinopsis sp. MPI-PUGE-AT-0042]|nr:ankyrin repeat-containing domain protein [Coprinopsis sp. MPI-PUGE-AT-0042]
MAGTGKSILVSLAINAVESHAAASTTPISVGFLYIRYSDHTKFTVRDLLEVLVKQTVERHPASLPLCSELYDRHIRAKTEPSVKELVGLPKWFTLEVMRTTFYFPDALDEAPSDVQLDLRESLTSLNVKLFLTSRPMKPLEARFPEVRHFLIVAREGDLDVHIAEEMSRSMELQAIIATSSPGLGGRITLAIKVKCSGMFLHASLRLQALRECTSRHELNKTLEDFPPQIKDVYVQTWNRIINQAPGKVSLATNALAWCLHGLVTLEGDTGIVRLVPENHPHRFVLMDYTAKAFLRSLIRQAISSPHGVLAAVCMARLHDCGLQRSAPSSKEDFIVTHLPSPLLEYAYCFWLDHARESWQGDDAALSRQVEVFGPLHVAAYVDLPLSSAGSGPLRSPKISATSTPLHLACIGNAPHAVKELLILPRTQINATSKRGWTALRFASEHGHEGIVDILLAYPQVKVNKPCQEGITPLYGAVLRRRLGTVKLLLAHPKVKVSQECKGGATPLVIACNMTKHMEILNALLAHPQINVNIPQSKSPLIWATEMARRDGVDVVKALLAHPRIDVNQKDKKGWPALIWARRHGAKAIEEILLAHPDIVDPRAPRMAAPEVDDARQSSISRLRDDFSRLSLPFSKK